MNNGNNNLSSMPFAMLWGITLITGITLLSVEEVTRVPRKIRDKGRDFWLRSLSLNGRGEHLVWVPKKGVQEREEVCMAGVRPVLKLDGAPLEPGTRIFVGNWAFDVILDGSLALCTTTVGSKEWGTKDEPTTKIFLRRWYRQEIVGQEIRKVA